MARPGPTRRNLLFQDVYKRQALDRYEHLLKLKDLYAQA